MVTLMKNSFDTAIGLILICFSGLIYGMTLQLPDSSSTGGLAPASFPRALAIVIACMSLLLVIKGFIKPGGSKEALIIGPFFRQMVSFFVIISGYIWFMPRIGYALSTFSFLIISIFLIMPQRSAKGCIKGFMFALLATGFVHMTFGIFLRVPLIEGPVDRFLRYGLFASLGAG